VPITLVNEIEKVTHFDVLLKNLKNSNNRYYEIIALHYYLYKASKEPGDINSYYMCRDFLFSNYTLYSKKQLLSLFIHLESYCISNIEPKSIRHEEMMKLYRFMFDNEIYTFTEGGYIHHVLFRNVLFSTSLSTIEWTDAFVGKHLPKVVPGSRDSLKYLWEAHRCYLTGDFEGILKHTHKIDFNPPGLQIDVKLLYLIAYYELGYFEEARSMTDTFGKYLKYSADAAQILKEKHLNYIDIYKKLLKMKETGNTSYTEELRKEINGRKNIVKRSWLIEKADELKSIIG
jgi:hypothetical protein